MANVVLGTIDMGGDGKEILIAAVNAAIGENFLPTDFVLSNPEVNENTLFPRNSKTRMQPIAASGYYGFNTVYYNRINGSALGAIELPAGSADGMTMVSELLPTINVAKGIALKPSDIYDAPIPSPDVNGVINITLFFSSSSIIFYDGAELIIPQLDLTSILSDDTPLDAQTVGDSGTSNHASRSDHTHARPSLSDMGIIVSATPPISPEEGTIWIKI